MLEKMNISWKSLNREITVNQRELLLGVAVCVLAGIVIGSLFSPKKTVTIGSNNGSHNSGNSAALSAGSDEEDEEEA